MPTGTIAALAVGLIGMALRAGAWRALAARAEARPGSSRSVEELLTAACLALIAALVAEIAATS